MRSIARLFKYPATLSRFLAQQTPDDRRASRNYMWNERLGCTFASANQARAIPTRSSSWEDRTTPSMPPEQQRYLERHPEIDFFVDGEGEMAFVEPVQGARRRSTSTPRDSRPAAAPLPSVHYMSDGEFVRGELLPRILDLDRACRRPTRWGCSTSSSTTS